MAGRPASIPALYASLGAVPARSPALLAASGASSTAPAHRASPSTPCTLRGRIRLRPLDFSTSSSALASSSALTPGAVTGAAPVGWNGGGAVSARDATGYCVMGCAGVIGRAGVTGGGENGCWGVGGATGCGGMYGCGGGAAGCGGVGGGWGK